MATKRQRASGSWEYIFKKKGLLPKPISLSFESESEGDEYARKLDALLNAGIVPSEFQERADIPATIGQAIKSYMLDVAVPDSDSRLLHILHKRIKDVRIAEFDYEYVTKWIAGMKVENRAPSTIRHYTGALARCMDWAVNKKALPVNPLRMLPKRYAKHSGRADEERDRRLEPEEEKRIRAVLAGKYEHGKERPLELKHREALATVFELALETAMRMREIYTLSPAQVDIKQRTVFLDKTKNGSKRQVPLSTVAVKALKAYKAHSDDRLFPWWDGKSKLEPVTALLSQQFARIFDAAGCPDLRFHDLRHEATSRFFEKTKLSDLQISMITGHKSLTVLKRYANLRASDLAQHLW